jgi:hypothetical protein
MNLKEFSQFFVGTIIGFTIYESLIYFSDPYNPDWVDKIVEIIILSIFISVSVSLVRWWFGNNSLPEDEKNA